jgi:hypothetical protein
MGRPDPGQAASRARVGPRMRGGVGGFFAGVLGFDR